MQLPAWFEITSLAVLLSILVADLALVIRRPHVPSTTEAGRWIAGYVLLALVFAGLLLMVGGTGPAGEFTAGWLTEYSLSVDNLFVFVILMASLKVPTAQQQRVLMVGILLSLVLRGGFILVGAAVIESLSWIFYLFGAFLVVTAVQLVRGGDEQEEYRENVLVRRMRRVLPVAPDFDGGRLTTRIEGRRLVTPMIVVFVAIGTTDLLFALDSIPAVFGLTQDPFLVFTATVFALMGLRQLYFLLGSALSRLVFLKYGLAVVLAFIGVKLVLEALHGNEVPFVNGGENVLWAPLVPTWLSLVVIVGVLATTTVTSLLATSRSEKDATASPPVG